VNRIRAPKAFSDGCAPQITAVSRRDSLETVSVVKAAENRRCNDTVAVWNSMTLQHRSALWAWLSRAWSPWRTVLVIVKPATVIAWHRRGVRLLWTWKSRRRNGRPPLAADVRSLIRTMARTIRCRPIDYPLTSTRAMNMGGGRHPRGRFSGASVHSEGECV
jgi:hypothetical protein